MNEWMEFDQILHMHLPQPELGLISYAFIFANYNWVMALC